MFLLSNFCWESFNLFFYLLVWWSVWHHQNVSVLYNRWCEMSNVGPFLLCSYFAAVGKTQKWIALWYEWMIWIRKPMTRLSSEFFLEVEPAAEGVQMAANQSVFFLAPAATRVNTQAARWRHVWHSSTPSQYSEPPLPHFISEASSYRLSICPHSRGSVCFLLCHSASQPGACHFRWTPSITYNFHFK